MFIIWKEYKVSTIEKLGTFKFVYWNDLIEYEKYDNISVEYLKTIISTDY